MTIQSGGLDDPRVQALLQHHVTTARAQTGRGSAHALYRSEGFVECAPFGDYNPDPNSVFMTLEL